MHKLTAHDAETQSLDLVADNIAKLSALFPEILTEGADGGKRLDFAALRELLGDAVEDKEERYNFTWHGKAQARRLAQTPSTGTLRPCPAESRHWDSTQNLFIEGDNLEVLKLLQKSYHQRVKMIYIDPPYNTGKDFIYPDNYRDNIGNYLELTGQVEGGRKMGTNTETSGRYHTNWLNMMYPRLKLARNLLREDGVIFISIDDTEIVNLRKLCDEIFGEENFVAQILWKKRSTPPNDKIIGANHDYILLFAKSLANVNLKLRQRSVEQIARYKNPDNHPKGVWAAGDLMANVKGGRFVQSLYFAIRNPNTGEEHFPGDNGNWRFSKETIDKLSANNEIYFGEDGKGRPKLKRFLSEVKDGITWPTIWDFPPLNTRGSEEMTELLGSMTAFENPKPSGLLEQVLLLGAEEGLVLDFFSGSGTTAHAVMSLNAEDGGNRQFILVQLPEPTGKADYPTIADIGKERIRRAGKKILADNAGKDGIDRLDVGFKTFKLDSTNIKPWDIGFDQLESALPLFADSLKDDRSAEDVLYEILLKYGLDLSLPITTHTLAGKTVYNIGMGALVVCLDQAITLDTVEGIATLKDELQPETAMRVVFRDSGFADDVVKVNAVQILKQAGIEDVRSV